MPDNTNLCWLASNLIRPTQKDNTGIVCLTEAERGYTVQVSKSNPKIKKITYDDIIFRYIKEHEDEAVRVILRNGLHWFYDGVLQKEGGSAVTVEFMELAWIRPSTGEKERMFGPYAVSVWDYQGFWNNGLFLYDSNSRIKESFLTRGGHQIVPEDVTLWKASNNIVDTDYFSFDYFSDPVHRMSYSVEFLSTAQHY